MLVDDADSMVFSFTDLGIKKALKKSAEGYPALNVEGGETKKLQNAFYKTLESDEMIKSGFVLTKETGLIESQAEYQIATAFLDQKLGANEVETADSFYKRTNTPIETQEDVAGFDSTASSYNNSGEGFVSNSILTGLTIKGGIGGQATGCLLYTSPSPRD